MHKEARGPRRTLVLFTRDLRVADNPALAEAASRSEHVVPLFVFDDRLHAALTPRRATFLLESLEDLRRSLRALGGDLIVRSGDPVAVALSMALEVEADGILTADDATPHARRRRRRLERAAHGQRLAVGHLPSIDVVQPLALTPSSGDHYRVFTPYWRAWQAARWRDPVRAPARLRTPTGIEPGILAGRRELERASDAGGPAGGERAGRRLVGEWLRSGLAAYEAHRDELAGEGTSHLSAHLHFGTVSALELATRVRDVPAAEAFLRQLCWRDFHQQVTAAFPAITTDDYRPRGSCWLDDPEGLEAWKEGSTGLPIVDAGMRQMREEGWMHNRARLITASFLTRRMGVDWRAGAAHFMSALVDADVANNFGNWQWVAGTGNDTRPNRRLNPVRQAKRFDPEGDYVRRYVPELAGVAGAAVHEPWRLPGDRRRMLRYPPPLVDPVSVPTARGEVRT